jgi:peptidoglycan hydrolase-like protein with peptidoglycan-binding domain
VTEVQLLVDSAKVSGVFPRIPTEQPITFAQLQTPDRPVPTPRRRRLGSPDPRVKQAQQQLIALGYLAPRSADGRFGPVTTELRLHPTAPGR